MPYASISLLALEAELLLDLDLHRQAVRVPAGLALHVVALHRLVAREEVLEDARDDVVDAGLAVGRGRALVEDEERRVVAALEALLEDVVSLPELEYAGVERREVDVRQDVLKPGVAVAEGCPCGAPLDRRPAATIHVSRFLLLLAGLPILPDACAPLGR